MSLRNRAAITLLKSNEELSAYFSRYVWYRSLSGLAYGFFCLDMPQLENAVASGSERAEMRHRLNVAAEGNWILLGNLITVVSIGFLSSKKSGE